MKNRDTRNLLHTTTPIQTSNQSSLAAGTLPDGGGFFALKNGVLRWYRRHLKKTYYIDFKQDGRNRERYYWDDLRFPVQAINLIGSASPPDVDTTTFPGTLLFDDSSEESIYGVAQMPPSWAVGSAIRPHVHWSPTSDMTGGDAVVWRLSLGIANIGDVMPATPTVIETVTDSTLYTTNQHAKTSFEEVAMKGYNMSCVIYFRFQRYPSAADTYANDVRLWEFGIHYQVDGLGSEQELVKLNL
jgi:hypothetical protein